MFNFDQTVRNSEWENSPRMGKARIEQLCAQLCRAENQGVIETVAAQLHGEIDEYVRNENPRPAPVIDLTDMIAVFKPTSRAA
jgi:hypothetical protein